MIANVLPFRPTSGTNAQDLADVWGVLPAGWHANTTQGEDPWIALDGPGGIEWSICRQDGQFGAWSVLPDGREVDLGPFRRAREAAEAVVQGWASAA